jgi:hypothetical protein
MTIDRTLHLEAREAWRRRYEARVKRAKHAERVLQAIISNEQRRRALVEHRLGERVFL